MKVILTLDDIITIIAIVVCIIFLIGVVVYAFTINILEKIRRHKNKIKRERSNTIMKEKTELGVDITMKELQAINKKCQELGWVK